MRSTCLGSMLSGGNSDPADITARGWAEACDEYQSWALKTRLKIPLLYGIDAVHGHNNVDGAVIFPHNIGLGATRDPRWCGKAARVTAAEVAGTAIQWAFAPCIAVARDHPLGPHLRKFRRNARSWSRSMGAAAVRGLQGNDLAQPGSVLACAKHFLGDGGTRERHGPGRHALRRGRRCGGSTCPATQPRSRPACGRSWFPTAAGRAKRCTATSIC